MPPAGLKPDSFPQIHQMFTFFQICQQVVHFLMSEIDEFDQHAGIGRTSSPGCNDKADKIGQHLCVRRDVKGDTDHRARKTGAIRGDIHAAPA